MTHEGFRQLVREMRQAQRAYFKGRSPDAMAEAKRLEYRVDRELEGDGRPTLFGEDEQGDHHG